MAATLARAPARPLHPLHAILLAFCFPLFLGTLLNDIAYANTYLVVWSHFASWLNAGGLFVGAFVLLWALVDLIRSRSGFKSRPALYFLLLLAMWVAGFFNALVHSKDAWGVMPEALWLSALTALLALAASWVGYSGVRPGETK